MNIEIIATIVGLIADVLAILTAFKSDKNNEFNLSNYTTTIIQIKEEYKSTGASSSDETSEEILKLIAIAAISLFALSIGLYLYLFVNVYLFPIFSILLFIAVFRLKKNGFPILPYTIQKTVFVFLLSKRFVTNFLTTNDTRQFFNSFSPLNLKTTDAGKLGENIRVIWDTLWKKLSSGVMIDRLTIIVSLVIVIIFWLTILSIIINIICPKRFRPLTLRASIICLLLLLLLFNLNHPWLIEQVGGVFKSIGKFLTDFFDGFQHQ